MRQVTGDEYDSILTIALDSEDYAHLRDHFQTEGFDIREEDADIFDVEGRRIVTIPFDDGDADTNCEIIVTVHDGGVLGATAGIDRIRDDEIIEHQWFEVDEQGHIHHGTV